MFTIAKRHYRKQSGKYFLVGRGGRLSIYAARYGYSSGVRIIPLSYEEACEWVETYLDGDEYVEVHDETEDAEDDKELIRLLLSEKAKSKLEKVSRESGKCISDLIEEIF